MTRRFACSVAVLVAAALLVGDCGNDAETAKFKKDFKAVNHELRGVGTDIGASIETAPGKSRETFAATLRSLARRTQAVLDRLSRLKPPDNVKKDSNLLKVALAKAVRDLSALASALSSNSADAAQAATRSLLPDSPAVAAPANAILTKLKIK